MPIIDIQRRLMQVGRVRMGEKGPKGEPKKLSTFRFTSASKTLLEQVADRYGGKVTEWQGAPDEGLYEVTTKASEIKIVLPPAYSEGNGEGPRYSQWYELWKGPECIRRCDGETEVLSEKPCLCAAAGEEGRERTCKIVTRLSFLLPGSKVGLWRLDTRGYYAAVESTAMLDVLRDIRDFVPATLRIEQRSRKVGGQTRRYIVPVLELEGFSVPELEPGETASLAINAPATAPPKPALPAGPEPPENPTFEHDTDFGQRPPLPGEVAAASTTQESAAPEAPPNTEERSPPEREADPDGGEASAPLDEQVWRICTGCERETEHVVLDEDAQTFLLQCLVCGSRDNYPRRKASAPLARRLKEGERVDDDITPLDPIVVQAGKVKITRGSAAGKTVAEAVADEPERCLRYLEVGKDEMLKAALTTYLCAVRPELMETA